MPAIRACGGYQSAPDLAIIACRVGIVRLGGSRGRLGQKRRLRRGLAGVGGLFFGLYDGFPCRLLRRVTMFVPLGTQGLVLEHSRRQYRYLHRHDHPP